MAAAERTPLFITSGDHNSVDEAVVQKCHIVSGQLESGSHAGKREGWEVNPVHT